jgi:primosomal protein N' (replication factor Y)
VTARTYKRAQFLHDTFFGTKGAILLGTHMAIPYLTKPVDLSVVVNMDALLATPTWRLEEENLGLLLKLREVTTGDVMVQTRTPDAPVLQYAKHATIEQFYTEELQLRQTFNYPPHVTFIHFTWQGTPEQVKETDAMLAARFKEYDISLYPNPFSPPDNPIRYGLIRMPASTWPHTELRNALQSLPPTVRVVINPDKIV